MALPILLLGATAIGVAPIFVRYRPVGLSATAAWRLLLAAPFLAAPWGMRRRGAARPRGRLTPKDLLLLALPGLLFAGDLGFWHQSVAMTSVANATFFTNCAPSSWPRQAGCGWASGWGGAIWPDCRWPWRGRSSC